MTNADLTSSEVKAVPKRKRSYVKLDRIVLSPEAIARLDGYVEATRALFPNGFEPSRTDLLHVIVMAHADALSKAEVAALWKKCMDPVRFARAVARRVEQSVSEGQELSIEDVMSSFKPKMGAAAPKNSKASPMPRKKTPSATSTDHPPPGG